MHASCTDLERILQNAAPEEHAAIEEHAKTCPSCAEELRAWNSLSLAARELHKEWDSPALWPNIRRNLVAGTERASQRDNAGTARLWSWFASWRNFSLTWQTAAAAATLLALLTGSALLLLSNRPHPETARDAHFLKNGALGEVERSEAAYVQAIDKLAAQTKPQLENSSSPLLTSYREKLLVIDSAIDDLRAQAGLNPSNAHLRRQLLAMYQKKQQTLGEILEEKR